MSEPAPASEATGFVSGSDGVSLLLRRHKSEPPPCRPCNIIRDSRRRRVAAGWRELEYIGDEEKETDVASLLVPVIVDE